MKAVDIAIVGGGPAGAATACGLAGSGFAVTLLERSAAPQHKVCGEFLSRETRLHLLRLGIDPGALGAHPIDRVAVTRGRDCAVAALPFPALSLSRLRLDEALLERATATGAELLRGVAVRSAEPLDGGWRLHCGEGREIRCRTLILATGKHALRGLVDARHASMVGLKMPLDLAPDARRALAGRVELFLFRGGYAGLELVEGGLANLCLFLKRSIVADLGPDWVRLRDFLVRLLPRLGEFLAACLPVLEKPVAVACPAHGYLPKASSEIANGLYPVGDRLAHIPPFTGDGLAIALGSAALAVGYLRRAAPAGAYFARARRLTAPLVRRAALLSRLAAAGAGRTLLVRAAAYCPATLAAIAESTRMPLPD